MGACLLLYSHSRKSKIGILACTKAISLSVVGPWRAIISCSGISVASMASTLLSPKYCRDASSSASCHISCHRMAMRISSVLTCG